MSSEKVRQDILRFIERYGYVSIDHDMAKEAFPQARVSAPVMEMNIALAIEGVPASRMPSLQGDFRSSAEQIKEWAKQHGLRYDYDVVYGRAVLVKIQPAKREGGGHEDENGADGGDGGDVDRGRGQWRGSDAADDSRCEV